MDGLKIDEVAKQSGLTKRTIRYYEEIGILPPPPRTEGGIRLYNQEHVELLKKVMNAKEVLGVSLEELQRFIKLSEMFESQRVGYKQIVDGSERKEKLVEVIQTVEEQLLLLDQKMEKIQAVRSDLERILNRAKALLQK